MTNKYKFWDWVSQNPILVHGYSLKEFKTAIKDCRNIILAGRSLYTIEHNLKFLLAYGTFKDVKICVSGGYRYRIGCAEVRLVSWENPEAAHRLQGIIGAIFDIEELTDELEEAQCQN
jgi:hypothetical protein